MNRVLRTGVMMLGVLALAGAASWLLTGGGAYHAGSPDHYPVTVRMWLNDSFVGGIRPAAGWPGMEASVLEMLAAGNDLIHVGPDSPRCPVWSVAWVSPAPGTPPGSQVYDATIQCARPGASGLAQAGPPDATLRELLETVGP